MRTHANPQSVTPRRPAARPSPARAGAGADVLGDGGPCGMHTLLQASGAAGVGRAARQRATLVVQRVLRAPRGASRVRSRL
jgi:hypothetical protein